MSDQEGDDQIAQRMDAMLLRLLETPPQSRAELAEAVQRAKRKKPTRARQRRKARAFCLGVHGFVRLPIQKPLALDAA
jgi:hypothetical protein